VKQSVQRAGGPGAHPPPLDLSDEVTPHPLRVGEGATRTGRAVALLRIAVPPEHHARVRAALRPWARVDHHALVPLLGVLASPDGALFAVVPSLRARPMLETELSPQECLRYMYPIARALKYLHSSRPPLVHGGVRADNFLLTHSGTPLLAGFGLDALGADGSITPRSDVLAFGCLLYELYAREPPAELMHQPAGMSDDVWALVCQCTQFEPALRPGMIEVARRLHDLLPR